MTPTQRATAAHIVDVERTELDEDRADALERVVERALREAHAAGMEEAARICELSAPFNTLGYAPARLSAEQIRARAAEARKELRGKDHENEKG